MNEDYVLGRSPGEEEKIEIRNKRKKIFEYKKHKKEETKKNGE